MTLDTLLLDLRTALRGWRRRPAGLLAAVLSVGVGVGAATAVIGSIDRLLGRPPLGLEGVHAVARLVQGEPQPVTRAELDLLGGAAMFTIAGHRVLPVIVGDMVAERAKAAAVSPAFFEVVDAVPLVGTLLGSGSSASPVAVVSEAYWRSRLGADPEVIGGSIRLDGQPFTLLGVLPASFVYPATDVAFWVPLDAFDSRANAPLDLIARPRESAGNAAAELRALGDALPGVSPAGAGPAEWRLLPVQELYITGPLRLAGRIGLATAVFVLLIACANVANLMIARGIGRESELAVRRALGAGRGRIASQMLAESAVVALVGGMLGVLFAAWADQGLLALWSGVPDSRPFPITGGFDGRTLLVASGATAAAALLFGVAPALRAARVEPFRALGSGSRALGDRGGRTQSLLAAGQVALALVLVSSATLLARSFIALGRADLGFEPAAAYAFSVARPALLAGTTADASADAQFAAELAGRLAALPAVAAAGAAESLPLDGAGRRAEYRTSSGSNGSSPLRVVTPGYHAALGIPLRAGRTLADTDVAGAADVIVVNESFARRHWRDASALGGTIVLDGRPFEIVGIVGDTREWGPHAEGPPIIYAVAAQVPPAGPLAFVLRTTPGTRNADAGLAALIRTTVAQTDAGAGAYDIASMHTRLRSNTARSELLMTVMTIFAAVALFLAVAGVHATVAHATRRRVPELAVRRALGATGGGIARLVFRNTGGLVLGGIALGLPLSFATAAALARFLAGTGPADPIAFAAAALLLAAGAAAAAAGPALRASRVAPLDALRDGAGSGTG